MTEIRSARSDDLEAIAAIEAVGMQDPWNANQIAESLRDHRVRVLLDENRIVGFLIYSTVLDESELLQIVVSPECRKRGFGRMLMEDFFSELKKDGIVTSFLEVRESNAPAIALYKSFGFTAAGIRKNYYPAENGRENAVVMGAQLC